MNSSMPMPRSAPRQLAGCAIASSAPAVYDVFIVSVSPLAVDCTSVIVPRALPAALALSASTAALCCGAGRVVGAIIAIAGCCICWNQLLAPPVAPGAGVTGAGGAAGGVTRGRAGAPKFGSHSRNRSRHPGAPGAAPPGDEGAGVTGVTGAGVAGAAGGDGVTAGAVGSVAAGGPAAGAPGLTVGGGNGNGAAAAPDAPRSPAAPGTPGATLYCWPRATAGGGVALPGMNPRSKPSGIAGAAGACGSAAGAPSAGPSASAGRSAGCGCMEAKPSFLFSQSGRKRSSALMLSTIPLIALPNDASVLNTDLTVSSVSAGFQLLMISIQFLTLSGLR